MAESILSGDFTKYLPSPLQKDEGVSALAKGAAQELLKVSGIMDRVLIWARIDEISEELLDVLAYDLHIDWYDYTYPVETKRRIVKNSVRIHRKLGTKYAVERALSDVYNTAKVIEWFEYGGEPFCFRVTVDIGNTGMDENTAREIVAKMRFYKNARSHCDGIYYNLSAETAHVKAGSCLLMGNSIRVKPKLTPYITADPAHGRAAGVLVGSNTMYVKYKEE